MRAFLVICLFCLLALLGIAVVSIFVAIRMPVHTTVTMAEIPNGPDWNFTASPTVVHNEFQSSMRLNWISILLAIPVLLLFAGLLLLLAFRNNRSRPSGRVGGAELTDGLHTLLTGLDKMEQRIANLETILLEHRR